MKSPKYKVIADYPDSPFKVGEILILKKYKGVGVHTIKIRSPYPDTIKTLPIYFFEAFPHIFERIEWWAKWLY